MSIVKGLIFYCLLYLRSLFFIVSRLLSFIALVAATVTFLMGTNPTMAWTCIAVSFTLFVLRHSYDSLLAKLIPPGTEYVLVE